MTEIAYADPHRGTTSTHHHGSHRNLLSPATPTVSAGVRVDAIIVPTARNAAAMRPAIELAAKLRCTLLALCSKWSNTAEILALEEAHGVKLIAIDVGEIPGDVMPNFQTCDVLSGTRFARWTDTSLKRNLGLLIAKLIGWKTVVFLDDDITVPNPDDLRVAAALTRDYAGVGLSIQGMPDNSVVCHAYREAGGTQDMFVGGGALAVSVDATTSFFPNIYNEDWFFLLDEAGLRSTTSTGAAWQKPYDPFARVLRARMEELGDCLAEGLFWLLDNGKSIKDADVRHWKEFLENRRGFITDVIGMVSKLGDSERRTRMLQSLLAARGRCHKIEPELCVRYVQAWLADQETWRQHLKAAFKTHVQKRGMQNKDRRSLVAVQGLLRSLRIPESRFHLSLPHEWLDEDAADLGVPVPVAVGE